LWKESTHGGGGGKRGDKTTVKAGRKPHAQSGLESKGNFLVTKEVPEKKKPGKEKKRKKNQRKKKRGLVQNQPAWPSKKPRRVEWDKERGKKTGTQH